MSDTVFGVKIAKEFSSKEMKQEILKRLKRITAEIRPIEERYRYPEVYYQTVKEFEEIWK